MRKEEISEQARAEAERRWPVKPSVDGWHDDVARANIARQAGFILGSEWAASLNPEPSTRSSDEMCGDWPAPCNCDDPETHDGATEEPGTDVQDRVAQALCAIEELSKVATLEEVQAGIQRWTRHRYEAERLIEMLADYGLCVTPKTTDQPDGGTR